MAASDMMSALMELCQEKHIDQLYLIDRLEQSLAKSYAEILHLEWGAKVTIDRTTGKIYVYRLEPIDDSMDEEGNFTEFEEIDVTPKNTSRIAAQHAKAEINAIVRNSPASRSTRSSPAVSVTSSAVPCCSPRPTSRSSRFARASRPSFRTSTSAVTRTSATSVRWASAICTISTSRP